MEKNIHEVQTKILIGLLFVPSARFSDLNITGLTNDHFTFHIKRLVIEGMVEKIVGGKYQLTAKGKEFANRLDTDTAKVERQPKTCVLVIGVRKDKRKTEFLVQQRLKQPYYGYHGFVTGKVRWGETISDAISREFFEETGLTGTPKLIGIEHKVDVKDGQVQEDKYFYVARVDNPKGNLITDFNGGKNLWLTEKKAVKLKKLFADLKDLFSYIEQTNFFFFEKKFIIDEY